jgi:hypothetical protein
MDVLTCALLVDGLGVAIALLLWAWAIRCPTV